MQKIAIIGCGGSGKSTLARDLGRLFGLPVFHLDQLYWKPGWVATPKKDWGTLHERLCRQPRWIVDGNYESTMDIRLSASDTVIFLDAPTWMCLWGAIQRFFNYRGRTRPDMANACPEQLTLEYLWWILTFRWKKRTHVLRRLQQLEHGKRVVILRSRRSVRDFSAQVAQHTCRRDLDGSCHAPSSVERVDPS